MPLFRRLTALAAACALFAAPGAVLAQNISSVPAPIVKAGEQALEYRIGYAFPDDGRPGAFAHRLHFQRAPNENWRWRVAIGATHASGGAFDLRFVQGEALRALHKPDRDGWSSGVIAQIAVPLTDGQPGRVRLGWNANVDIDERWQARGVVFTGHEFGDNARKGLLLELRGEATYRLADGTQIGPQLYSHFGTTAHIGPFSAQKHQIGFTARREAASGLAIQLGAAFGVSTAASDVDLRLFVTKRL